MDKKQVLAIILLSILFTMFLWIGQPKVNNSTQSLVVSGEQQEAPTVSSVVEERPALSAIKQGERPKKIEKHTVETDCFIVEFATYGASITSMQLKGYTDEGLPLEMVQKGSDDLYGAFLLYFDKDNQKEPFYGPYQYREIGPGQYEFIAQASVAQNGKNIPFTIVKTFTFFPNEYMFEVKVALIQPNGQYLPLNFDGYSYTLESGPQIGPSFTKLDYRQVYRQPIYFNGHKSKILKLGAQPISINDHLIWAGIDGKYFAAIGVPAGGQYTTLWSRKDIKTQDGVLEGTQLAFARTKISSSRQEDRFYFYMGPKLHKELVRYNHAEHNKFGLANLKLDHIAPTMKMFGWLETFFKHSLEFIHRFVPNWGWTIVILTVLVKIVLFPLTVKSMISTAKMGELQPKLKAIQEKYKSDPTELQKAQFDLYKKEGINPMAGCLPLLLQLPIFIALYNLFNKFFELRGAHFFGWIVDLSSADVVMKFAHPLPILGWTGLHLLPIIYVISQLLMNKLMQSGAQGQTEQMRMVMWMMPLMFFFIFYNVASALLVYWIISNIISALQQVLISHLKKTGRLSGTQPASTKSKGKKRVMS